MNAIKIAYKKNWSRFWLETDFSANSYGFQKF